MRITAKALLVPAALATVPLAGCGGDDDESTTETATLSMAKDYGLVACGG